MKADEKHDAHIRTLYCILIPFAALSIVGFFIALLSWNSLSDPDNHANAITWSLSVLQIVLAIFAIILGIGALFGFWLLREAAITSAEREAREYLDRKAGELFEQVWLTRDGQGKIERPELPLGLNEAEVLSQAEEEDG